MSGALSKPDFHAQASGDEMADSTDRQAWFRQVAQEFKERGATWVRYVIVDKYWTNGPDQMLVVDGWKVRPDTEGEPYVDLTYARSIMEPKQCQ